MKCTTERSYRQHKLTRFSFELKKKEKNESNEWDGTRLCSDIVRWTSLTWNDGDNNPTASWKMEKKNKKNYFNSFETESQQQRWILHWAKNFYSIVINKSPKLPFRWSSYFVFCIGASSKLAWENTWNEIKLCVDGDDDDDMSNKKKFWTRIWIGFRMI